jgi:prepilin-type N-terminal cleavage/methylation domain-containing protein
MQSPPPDKSAHNSALRAGFTLIELSIVIIIIGLIVGGILVGQDLIKNAAIQATVTQSVQFKTAANAFYGKYNCLPGDCASAAAMGFTSPNPASYPVNGNGDGIIGDTQGYLFGGNNAEQLSFWLQLYQAGYIPTNPSLANPAGWVTSKIRQDSWWVGYSAHASNLFTGYATGPLGNVLALVGVPGACGFYSCGGARFSEGLTPIEAQMIDTKLDDGMPNSGSVQAATSGNWIDFNDLDLSISSTPNLCVNGYSSVASSPYAAPATNNNTRCNLLFKLGW